MTETLRVIFRADENDGEVLAYFPDRERRSWNGVLYECYAHIGQHSECSLDYLIDRTRPATEAEYAPLLAELRGIYETGPDAVKLKVVKRR